MNVQSLGKCDALLLGKRKKGEEEERRKGKGNGEQPCLFSQKKNKEGVVSFLPTMRKQYVFH